MKKIIIGFSLIFLTGYVNAQTPNTNDLQKMLDDAMKSIPPEAKKMMDSMGMKMPDANVAKKNIPKNVTKKQIQDAVDNANRLVPLKNKELIAKANKRLKSKEELKSFLVISCNSIQKGLGSKIMQGIEKIESEMKEKKNGNEVTYSGTALMLMLKNEANLALAAFTKEFERNTLPDFTDLNNFSALCNMMGGQAVSLPILNFLNKESPDNTIVLNNIGQAWFTCGEQDSAMTYLLRSTKIKSDNPEACLAISLINESKGNKTEAEKYLKKSIQKIYSKKKEDLAKKFGIKLTNNDFSLPPELPYDPLGFKLIELPVFQSNMTDYYNSYPPYAAWREAVEKELSGLRVEYNNLQGKHADNMVADINNFQSQGLQFNGFPQGLGEAVNLTPIALEMNSFLEKNPSKLPVALLLESQKNLAKIDDEFNERKEEISAKRYEMKGGNSCYSNSENYELTEVNLAATIRMIKHVNELVRFRTEELYFRMYTESDQVFELLKTDAKIKFLEDLLSTPHIFKEPSCKNDLPKVLTHLSKWEDTHCPVYADIADPTGSFKLHWDCHGSVQETDLPIYKEKEIYKYDDKNQLTISGSYWMGFEVGKTLGGKGAENLPVKLGVTGSLGYYQETEGGTLLDGFAQLYDIKDRPKGNVITDQGVQSGVEGKAELNLTNKKYFGQEGAVIDKITSDPFEQETASGTKTSLGNPNILKQDVGGVKPEVKLGITGKLSFNNAPNTITPAASIFGWNGTNFSN